MRLWTWLLVTAALIMPVSANAEGANYIKRGFSFPTDHRPRILVLYPDWFIGSLTSKGEGGVNPEWEALMFTNVRAALAGGPVGGVADLRFMMPEQAAASPVLQEVRKAFIPLTGELIFRVPQGSTPVQKGKKGYYDYSIGADLAARVRQAHGEAEFALVVLMHDAYATSGQKLGSILGATAAGMVSPPGSPAAMRALPPHYGNSMLVDLKDGSVVWFHGDGAFGGDPRTPAGAQKRMAEAMEHFPGTEKPNG